MSRSPATMRRFASLLALTVLAGLLVLAVSRLDLARTAAHVARAQPLWVVAAFACFAAILPLWALQWWLLAPPVPRRTPRNMLGVVAMTSSVLNTTPMLVGEAAGVYFLSERTGVDRASGLAVLAMDQLLVGLAKVAVLTSAAVLLPLPQVMRDGVRLLSTGVALLLGVLALVTWRSSDVERIVAPRLPVRYATLLVRCARALAPLRSPMRGGGALALALVKKGCELVAILAIQRAFGVVLPLSSALIVLAALNLATLLPIVPGNAGIFEAAVVFAYSRLGVPAEQALGMAVVQHACYFVALALPGYAWLVRVAPARSAAAAP